MNSYPRERVLFKMPLGLGASWSGADVGLWFPFGFTNGLENFTLRLLELGLDDTKSSASDDDPPIAPSALCDLCGGEGGLLLGRQRDVSTHDGTTRSRRSVFCLLVIVMHLCIYLF